MNCQCCRRKRRIARITLLRGKKAVADVCSNCFERFFRANEYIHRGAEGIEIRRIR